jgi:hypothetical protein
MGTPQFVWFVYSVLMAAINAWVLYSDLKFEGEQDTDEETLKQFLLSLANELLQQ